MKSEMRLQEAVCVFADKPQTPILKRAEKTVRKTAAILSFKEWSIEDASSALETDVNAMSRMLAIFGSPGFEDIHVFWFADGKFLVYLREPEEDDGEPPF